MRKMIRPTIDAKVRAAVFGLDYVGGMADTLMWPRRHPECSPAVAPDWAHGLEPYSEQDVRMVARKALSYALRELVKQLPDDAKKRIWDALADDLGIDAGDAEQMAGYAIDAPTEGA